MNVNNEGIPLWLKALYYIVPTFGASGLMYLFRYFMKGTMYNKNTKIEGKIVLITGVDSEVGKETAIDLAKRDGKIYIACEDNKTGEDVLSEIKTKSKRDNIYFLELNLGSLESIRECAKKFHDLENKLDILINNHKVVCCARSKTVDGFENHLGINYLGPFLFTNLLMDLMKNSAHGRIIFENSIVYRWGLINKEDLMSENSYSRIKAYCQSKLAVNLLAHEMSKKLFGSNITVNISFPGFVISDLVRRITGIAKVQQILEWIGSQFVNTAKEGAQTTIYASVDADLKTTTGKFFGNCSEIKISGDSVNDELSAWLWKKSEKLLEINYV